MITLILFITLSGSALNLHASLSKAFSRKLIGSPGSRKAKEASQPTWNTSALSPAQSPQLAHVTKTTRSHDASSLSTMFEAPALPKQPETYNEALLTIEKDFRTKFNRKFLTDQTNKDASFHHVLQTGELPLLKKMITEALRQDINVAEAELLEHENNLKKLTTDHPRITTLIDNARRLEDLTFKQASSQAIKDATAGLKKSEAALLESIAIQSLTIQSLALKEVEIQALAAQHKELSSLHKALLSKFPVLKKHMSKDAESAIQKLTQAAHKFQNVSQLVQYEKNVAELTKEAKKVDHDILKALLCRACWEGERLVVHYLLSTDLVNKETTFPRDLMPFHHAVYGGHYRICQLLGWYEIPTGLFDLSAKSKKGLDNYGNNLLTACVGAYLTAVAELQESDVSDLTANQKNVLQQRAQDFWELLEKLVVISDRGSSEHCHAATQLSSFGMTALGDAAAHGSYKLVSKLISRSAVTDPRTLEKYTRVRETSAKESGIKPDICLKELNERGDNIFHLATRALIRTERQLQAATSEAQTRLEKRKRDQQATLTFLFDQLTDVSILEELNVRDESPLQIALNSPITTKFYAGALTQAEKMDCSSALATFTSLTDADGNTPLHIISRLGLETQVRALLNAKANFLSTNAAGNMPLHEAVLNNRIDVVRTLLDHRAPPSHVNEAGMTPLAIAKAGGHKAIITLLEEHSAREKNVFTPVIEDDAEPSPTASPSDSIELHASSTGSSPSNPDPISDNVNISPASSTDSSPTKHQAHRTSSTIYEDVGAPPIPHGELSRCCTFYQDEVLSHPTTDASVDGASSQGQSTSSIMYEDDDGGNAPTDVVSVALQSEDLSRCATVYQGELPSHPATYEKVDDASSQAQSRRFTIAQTCDGVERAIKRVTQRFSIRPGQSIEAFLNQKRKPLPIDFIVDVKTPQQLAANFDALYKHDEHTGPPLFEAVAALDVGKCKKNLEQQNQLVHAMLTRVAYDLHIGITPLLTKEGVQELCKQAAEALSGNSLILSTLAHEEYQGTTPYALIHEIFSVNHCANNVQGCETALELFEFILIDDLRAECLRSIMCKDNFKDTLFQMVSTNTLHELPLIGTDTLSTFVQSGIQADQELERMRQQLAELSQTDENAAAAPLHFGREVDRDNLYQVDQYGNTLLHVMVLCGCPLTLLRRILSIDEGLCAAKNDDQETVLHRATGSLQPQIVRLVLERVSDEEARRKLHACKSRYGRTAIMDALSLPIELEQCASGYDIETVEDAQEVDEIIKETYKLYMHTYAHAAYTRYRHSVDPLIASQESFSKDLFDKAVAKLISDLKKSSTDTCAVLADNDGYLSFIQPNNIADENSMHRKIPFTLALAQYPFNPDTLEQENTRSSPVHIFYHAIREALTSEPPTEGHQILRQKMPVIEKLLENDGNPSAFQLVRQLMQSTYRS